MRVKILVGAILGFVILCTWSDYYYSKLERDYPMLSDTLSVQGVITHYKVHWKYSYITIDSKKRVVVRPTTNEAYKIKHFHDLIDVGDSIYKDSDSFEILIKKNDRVYKFINNQL